MLAIAATIRLRLSSGATTMSPHQSKSEAAIQRAVFQHLAVRGMPGVFAFYPPNGGWRWRMEPAILKGLGVRPGVPGVIAFKSGRADGLELKTSAGRLTAAQRDVLAANTCGTAPGVQ